MSYLRTGIGFKLNSTIDEMNFPFVEISALPGYYAV